MSDERSVSALFQQVVASFPALLDDRWLVFNAMIGAIQENRPADAALYGMKLGLYYPEATQELHSFVDQRALSHHNISELYQQVHGAAKAVQEASAEAATNKHNDKSSKRSIFAGQNFPTSWFHLHKFK
jgi:hypothetical protein